LLPKSRLSTFGDLPLVEVVGDAVFEPRVVDADLLSVARQVEVEHVAPGSMKRRESASAGLSAIKVGYQRICWSPN
jgi:hypothetical protein